MPILEVAQGRVLVTIARTVIENELGVSSGETREDSQWLQQPGACFVTLERYGELRGCVGSLEERRALGKDVRTNARMAAFQDRRFAPLIAEELEGVEIKVSVLSRPELLPVRSEAELLGLLRPGVDGLVVEHGVHRATFLPQVWQHLPEPEDFLGRLREKAGLPPGFWADGIRIHRYSVQSWDESVAILSSFVDSNER